MIRVLVVDDSPLVRRVIADMLGNDPAIGEVTTAANGEMALNKLPRVAPDVITMDLEMPGMGGLETIRRIMETMPTPVVVISGAAKTSAKLGIRAMELGAVDVIEKPGSTHSGEIRQIGQLLREAVKNAARAHLAGTPAGPASQRRSGLAAGDGSHPRSRHFEVVAFGASTGGPIALKEILLELPADFPAGMAIVQHMPAGFTSAYAERLNTLCRLRVREARDGEALEAGTVLIAPGNIHLRIVLKNGRPVAALDDSEKVNNHRPSVDVLMSSVAAAFGRRAVGVIMTGMGRDGVNGIGELRAAGGYVMAQDEPSSVIYGMNRAVVEAGTCDEIVPLGRIAERLLRLTSAGRTRKEGA